MVGWSAGRSERLLRLKELLPDLNPAELANLPAYGQRNFGDNRRKFRGDRLLFENKRYHDSAIMRKDFVVDKFSYTKVGCSGLMRSSDHLPVEGVCRNLWNWLMPGLETVVEVKIGRSYGWLWMRPPDNRYKQPQPQGFQKVDTRVSLN